MVSVKLSENATVYRVSLLGNKLSREASAPINLEAALVRLGDTNLEFTFEESDREELMKVDTKLLPLISAELDKEILTHIELANLLLPPVVKPKPKKTTPKPKKSSLVE